MVEVMELIAGLFIFAVLLGSVVGMLNLLVRHDTTAYDLEFCWDGKYTRDQLDLP